MQIDNNILITYGAVAKRYKKGEFIYSEGEFPHFYFQIIEGEVRTFCTNRDGRELNQGLYRKDDGFGESSLLLSKSYNSTSQTLTDCVLLRISREKLINIFADYPEVPNKLLYGFADQLYKKEEMMQIWACNTPEEKITQFLSQNFENESKKRTLIPYTRQAIADFTGLRVETVIRTLSQMSKKGKVSIVNRKLYY